MSALLDLPSPAVSVDAVPAREPAPASRLAGFGPNWFASAMGTGIVANAAALLPVHLAPLADVALGVWVLATLLLGGLLLTAVAHLMAHPQIARGHHTNPKMAPFYGAPAMALLTVGSGALLVGHRLVGTQAAVVLDAGLWVLGSAIGLLTAIAIPYLMFTRQRARLEDVNGSWLMAVVPPMVSASAGAGLIERLPGGQARLTLELVCGAGFGVSLVMALVLLVLLWARLAFVGVHEAASVPTLWIVLGPLGQGITAAGLLAGATHARAAVFASVLFGLPVWGFALAWFALATLITLGTARRGLPFSLSWWSFTFPLGTLVTGTSVLAEHTHAVLLVAVAFALYALLVLNVATVAVRTVRGTINRTLFA